MSVNGNGNNKILYGILSLFGSIIILALTYFIAQINALDTRINIIEITVSRMNENLRQVDDTAKTTRNEQIDRTFKLGDILNRLSILELNLKLIDSRITTLSVNQKLENKVREAQ